MLRPKNLESSIRQLQYSPNTVVLSEAQLVVTESNYVQM